MPEPQMREDKTELEWFLELAQLQFRDESRSKEAPTFFWDTADVSHAILGMSGFYEHSAFDEAEFSSPRTLVRCLASAGWFGSIQLLLPHQEELLNLLDRNFSLPPAGLPPGGAQQFLRDALGRPHLSIDASSSTIDKDISELVQIESGHAETLFKAVQSIGFWETRLKSWRDSERLNVTVDKMFDYEAALATPRLEKLRCYFRSRRPNLPVNNFTDAMALCYLQHLLDRALDAGTALPILYVSSPLTTDAVRFLGDTTFLTYPAEAGVRVPILRDSEYFVFRASLYPAMELKSAAGVYDLPSAIFEDLKVLIKSIGGQHREETKSILEQTSLGAVPLVEVVRDMRRLWFLDRVWLPFAAAQELKGATKEYVDTAKKLATSAAYKQQVTDELQKTARVLESNVHAFSEVRKLWLKLNSNTEVFRSALINVASSVAAIELQSGLIRFGFTEETYELTRCVVSDLLSENDQTRNNRVSTLIHEYRRVQAGKRRDPVSFAIFWILSLDDELIELCKREKRRPEAIPFWIDLLHASALLRARKVQAEAELVVIVENLKKTLSGSERNIEAGPILCGLGYIYFHWWKLRGGGATWRSIARGRVPEVKSVGLIRSAIDYASLAMEAEHIEPKLRAYALNQFVYYVTEGGSEEVFDRISDFAAELMSFGADHTIWQYRFDDTLARYFHRLALASGDPLRSELFDKAASYMKNAESVAGDDPDVRTYASQLLIARSTRKLAVEKKSSA